MQKSPNAFRSISEAAELIGTKTHVLRFWETKFAAIKPVKRGDGRRYYRPNDIQLIRGIKKLLHDDGLTVKSVQQMIATEGADHVAALAQDNADPPAPQQAETPAQALISAPAAPPPPAPEFTYEHNIEDPDHQDQFLLFNDSHFETPPQVQNTPQPLSKPAPTGLPANLQADRAISAHAAQFDILSRLLALPDADRAAFAQKNANQIAKLRAILS